VGYGANYVVYNGGGTPPTPSTYTYNPAANVETSACRQPSGLCARFDVRGLAL